MGCAIEIILGLSNFFIILFSFLLGIFTCILTVLISKLFKNRNNITLVLSGIIVGGFMSSILTTIKYFVNPETQLSNIVYWLMGSFANVTYNNIIFMFPIVLISVIFLLLISHRINLIALGRDETETHGINYILYRNIIISISTILTATTVSCCGTISWIGLIIPHIVKSIVGRNVNNTIPTCAIFGAIFTLTTDILSKKLTQSEIPISAITGVLGSIIFTIILIRININAYKIRINNNNKNAQNEINIKNFINDSNNTTDTIIKLENKYFKYKKNSKYILNNISFTIPKNKIFLLYGVNGSGKTTLLKIISGLLKPSVGYVYIKEKLLLNSKFINIDEISLNKRSKMISYVKQDFTSINNILVSDYLLLRMINELKFYEKTTIEQINKMYEYSKKLNITNLLDKKIQEISGGQRQIVLLCQSLLQNADILIFDEPTSSLDYYNEKIIIKTLTKLSKNFNKTIIIATYNMSLKNLENTIIKIM